jgi:hypothetical protein
MLTFGSTDRSGSGEEMRLKSAGAHNGVVTKPVGIALDIVVK